MTVAQEMLRKCAIRAKIEVVRTLLEAIPRELHAEKPGEHELQGVLLRVRRDLEEASKLLSLRSPEVR